MKRKNKTRSRSALIESLESRILFAVTIAVGGKSATYTDFDGDAVTIKISKGSFTDANFSITNVGLGDSLLEIDLTTGGFDNTDLSLTVKKAATGDGLANVGRINSSGHDLGAVTVPGDLGRIIAGDNATPNAGLKSLSARSMGRFDLDNQPDAPSLPLTSSITGMLGTVNIKGDVNNVALVASSFGAITIGGSFIAGSLTSIGSMGAVKINGDLRGTTAFHSGYINVGTNIASLTIGGSIFGTGGISSGSVFAFGNIGPVSVKGSLLGGTGFNSGSIAASGNIGNVTIGGSIVGGVGQQTGAIVPGGTLGNVTVKFDLVGNVGMQSGAIVSAGNMGNVTIGGSVVGATGDNSGSIYSTAGGIGALKIGGDLLGGTAAFTGNIATYGGNIKTITIGGSVVGGGGFSSGYISSSANITSVAIARDLRGGSAPSTGVVLAANLSSIKIGGAFLGGTESNSGNIYITNALGTVTIGSDFVGGNAEGVSSILSSGLIWGGTIASVTVGGSILAGFDNSAGTLDLSGAIVAADTLGTLSVKGSLIGSVGLSGNITPVTIMARGQAVQTGSVDLAIKSITVAGRVERTNILAGYQVTVGTVATNGDAQIGTISIGGDFIASNIVAGAQNTTTNFGDGNDSSIDAGNPLIGATIGSVTIGGIVFGTPDAINNADHFGIVAQYIKAVKIGGAKIALNPLPSTDNIAIGFTGDFNIHEV